MSENMAFILFRALFHVRACTIPASVRSPHGLWKPVVAVVGLSVVSSEFLGSESNRGDGTACGHLVARYRGAVLSGLALGHSILLSHSVASRCHCSDLCFSGAPLLPVIAPR